MKQAFLTLLSIIILIVPATSFASVCGDVNDDEAVNVGDAVYLINYVFRGGPEPICTGTVTDIDGNIYSTIRIGDQWWMLENLKVTHYRNCDPIPNILDNSEWVDFREGAYCNYDNSEGHVDPYGRLYNWYAVNDGRNIAPEGWHIPSDEEWKQLEMYLGMSQAEADGVDDWRGTDEGGKLKESGTIHWLSPNTGATNASGFTALPAGFRTSAGDYMQIGESIFFWTSTESSSGHAWSRYLDYLHSQVYRYNDPYEWDGFSVRCVKD